MKHISLKKEKILKNFKQIEKTDLTSAHMIAGKLIFEKCFKARLHNKQYIDDFLYERGDIEIQDQAFIKEKLNEIKTPLTKKKIAHILSDIVMSKKTSIEKGMERKKEEALDKYKKQREGLVFFWFLKNCIFLVRKIMSSKIINVKDELNNDILNFNKSYYSQEKEENISIDLKLKAEKRQSSGSPQRKMLGSEKFVNNMKEIFDL